MALANCAEASQEHAGAKNELPLILPNFKLKQVVVYYIRYCISSYLACEKKAFFCCDSSNFQKSTPNKIKMGCVVT